MSRTIESLRKIPSKEAVLQDHIAETYFYRKTQRKKDKTLTKKIQTTLFITMLCVAVFLLVLSLALLHNYYISTVKEKIAASKIVHIFSSGILNKNIIKNFEFRGYAIDKSGFSNKMLVLINTKKYNWADASIDFKFPMDLSRRKLSLTIKGKIGGERISLVLLDSNNRSYRLNDIYLASNWNTDTISFDNIKGGIDLSKITQLRFEYGYVGESSKLMDSLIELTVYIKNIELIKEA